ncbi:helix-turn-helix transcriptional regulator [Streptomyces lavendulae]|uniref:helix-turn-helix domain-containing protein n=1 Tax=Streptomyces lavendulae TaxID=1914 RepID=UPI0033F2246B
MRIHGISQRNLARRSLVSQPYISLLLRGERGALPETAWRIAVALKVDVEELFISRGDSVPHRIISGRRLVPTQRNASKAASLPAARMKAQARIRPAVKAKIY